ncbi:GDSL-type esterase/lipase family protein [Engelhardtia mirabilis]|uniref:Acetylxylan esterase n=1 Tax=Engelhardtia mirabilis TaxID=2528011 RepID=A0A518BKK5_9BACT|nr:Acetylxylan esterase precursor [Planctomycetes bacterium Pla133]QDV01830.1 Acetylxylan esterase precursor [Planctomycetes bacterium Pla86]
MRWIPLLVAWSLLLAPAGAQSVLCLGDSITAGAGSPPGTAAWPELLAQRLGPGAQVAVIAAGGASLSSVAARPLLETAAWKDFESTGFETAVVVLGTNDSVAAGEASPWEDLERFDADVERLLDAVRGRFAVDHILLCTPTPMLAQAPGLSPERRADLTARAPRIQTFGARYRALAKARPDVEFVDLGSVWGPDQVVDGVHPNAFGAAALADHLASILRIERDPEPAPIRGRLLEGPLGCSETDYHGFDRLEFGLPGDGAGCTLVLPRFVAAGRPWIWRARFFGHEPALDVALLERGFHLFYCDVAGLFGAPAAMARWDAAYSIVVDELGLGPQPVLHGLSRGGLPVLEFAIAHPHRVGAIVLDNAVCDFRSWPGGRNGQRSDADWLQLLEVWGLTDEDAMAAGNGALERLAPLVDAGISVHVLIGTADRVVPPEENGLALLERYRSAGGDATLWSKPGEGHHPHGLEPVAPLARALLRDVGIDRHNPATWPLPSVEYRSSAAGWGPDSSWSDQVERMAALAEANPQRDLVFLGDSITQGLTGAGDRLSHPNGPRAIDRFERAICLGLSGDRTEHLLYRIEHGALAKLAPRVIVLQIGVNNVNSAGHTGPEVAGGLQAVVESLARNQPQATVLICGPFPVGLDPDDPRRSALDAVHGRARVLAARDGVEYLDLRPLFLDEDGHTNGRMAADAIHVTAEGQVAWMDAIEPAIRRLLGP